MENEQSNNKKKASWSILLLFLLIIPLLIIPLLIVSISASAVIIETGTNYYNPILKTSINCTSTYYANTVNLNDTGITFDKFNPDDSSTNYVTFTVLESNKQYLCSDLPYITGPTTFSSGSIDTVTYTITSGLPTINSVISLNHTDCVTSVGDTVKYNLNTITYQCSAGQINFTGSLNTGANTLVITYNKLPQPGGGGGGGGQVTTFNVTKELCELTYKYAENKSYDGIYDIIDVYKLSYGKTASFSDVKETIDNWQSYCSDKVNRSLYEPYICNKLYNMIVTKGFNYAYVIDLKNDLKSKVSISTNLLVYYTNNYNKMCYSKGLSSRLPANLENLLINNTKFSNLNCTLDNGVEIFDFYIPLGDWNLGTLDSCSTLNFLRYFMKFTKYQDNFYFSGIRLYIIVILILIVFLIIIFKENSFLNKRIDKSLDKFI